MTSFDKTVTADFIIGTGCWVDLYERQLDSAISGKTPTVTKNGDDVNITWDIALSAPDIVIQDNITAIHTSIIPWQTALLTNVNSIKDSCFSAYDNGGGQVISTSWVDITWDTQTRIDDSYSHVLGTSDIVINETAYYDISMDLTINHTSGSNRTKSEMKLVLNGSDMNGTKSLMYHRQSSAGGDTGTINTIRSLVSGDILKVQCIRVSGSGPLATYPEGSRITIKRLNN